MLRECCGVAVPVDRVIANYTPRITPIRSTYPLHPEPYTLTMRQPAVRAPEFPEGLDWIHTGGRALTLADFRGKILLLDFWTYG